MESIGLYSFSVVKKKNKHTYSFPAEPVDCEREFNILTYTALNLKKRN
jgi:hypothetical protein